MRGRSFDWPMEKANYLFLRGRDMSAPQMAAEIEMPVGEVRKMARRMGIRMKDGRDRAVELWNRRIEKEER